MSKTWSTPLALLVLVAFLSTACQKGTSSTGPSPLPEPNAAIYYSAIGASDAIGIGSSAECLPYVDCPHGRGYVQVVARDLKARGHSVTLNNLGIPTAVISRTFQSLGTQDGSSRETSSTRKRPSCTRARRSSRSLPVATT